LSLSAGVPVPFLLAGILNVILVATVKGDCNSTFNMWCAVLATVAAIGLELWFLACIRGTVKLGSGTLEAHSKKIVCGISWFLAAFLLIREVSISADILGLVSGIVLALVSTLHCLSFSPSLTNGFAIVSGLLLLCWLLKVESNFYYRPASSARLESLLIIATVYGVALANLVGGSAETSPVSSPTNGTELTQVQKAQAPKSKSDGSGPPPGEVEASSETP